MQRLLKRAQQSLGRADMQSKPLSALTRRVWWKLRWAITQKDWPLTLDNGQRLIAPQSGVTALIYYLGSAEPVTTGLLHRLLKPGMVVFDIGAHLGEYALRAAAIVGETGHVHAFEPDPIMAHYLQENVTRNRLGNITVQQTAVADVEGEMQFAVQSEPSISSLVPSSGNLRRAPVRTLSVPVRTIDTYCTEQRIEHVDFIKIDIEGAEYLAFRGAKNLLSQPPGHAPTIYFEHTARLIQPFGYSPAEILEYLSAHGYTMFNCPDDEDFSPVDLAADQEPFTQNLLAIKQSV